MDIQFVANEINIPLSEIANLIKQIKDNYNLNISKYIDDKVNHDNPKNNITENNKTIDPINQNTKNTKDKTRGDSTEISNN